MIKWFCKPHFSMSFCNFICDISIKIFNIFCGPTTDKITLFILTPNNTNTSSTTNTTNTTTSSSGDYSWIVGTWDCELGAYGKVVLNFEGDGTTGRCSELKADGTYRYGSYNVNGDVLSYKLTGESFPTTIKIESGRRLSDGDGVYYHKKNWKPS